jgi:RNA polymerase sigma factor (sigma-70 family)
VRANDTSAAIDNVTFGDLYAAHYVQMVRLAGYLLGRADGAEDIAQEAFIRLASARNKLRDPSNAVAYLRQVVVNACRSHQRHLVVVDRHARTLTAESDVSSAEESALTAFDRDLLVQALGALSKRKLEVVGLRYYCDFSEAGAASALGISVGAVKSLGSRGLADLAMLIGGAR